MTFKLHTFTEALRLVGSSKPHLLMGNGFSIACRPDIFTYKSLLESADFSEVPAAKAAFEVLSTTDFEIVIQRLLDTSRILPVYDNQFGGLVQQLQQDAGKLKEILLNAIAGKHPSLPSEISDDSYDACRRFLANFKCFYTVSYDLLLYWTLMHRKEGDPNNIKHDDGFRSSDNGDADDYVIWDGETGKTTGSQNVHYLHGALHLFDRGYQLQKYCWERTRTPIMTQARKALDEGLFPLFVAEGSMESKMTRIQHSGYLQRSLKSFANVGNAMFIFGLSFSENDEHILRKIETGKLENVFISLYGDPESDDNKRIRQRAERMVLNRPEDNRNSLKVRFFDADSANVWGKVDPNLPQDKALSGVL